MNEFFKKPVVKILMLKGEKGDKGDTGTGLSAGGKTGQYLLKKSDADYDYVWSAITTVSWDNVSEKPDAYPTTWEKVTGKQDATTSASGLMSADDKSKLDDLQVGGRNLLLNSGVEITNNEYEISHYYVSPSEGEVLSDGNGYLVPGKTYTVTICATPGENVKYLGLYVSSGTSNISLLNFNGNGKQILKDTFKCRYTHENEPSEPYQSVVRLLRFPNESGVTYGNTTIYWIKIESGTMSTDWTPAPEDVDSKIDALNSATKSFTLSASSWSSGSYTISDSLITATSNQEIIPSQNITADQMKALQKANIIDSGQSAGSLTLKALGTVPSIDIPIRIIFRGTI